MATVPATIQPLSLESLPRISLKSSLAYRARIGITAVCLLSGWLATLLSGPISNAELEWRPIAIGAGALLLIAGVLIRLWSTATIAGYKRVKVVCEGPYALCRNPLYWGTLLIGISTACFLQSWWFACSLIPPIVLYLYGVVPAEERYLSHHLGQDYAEYCQRTSRWIPRWSALRWQRPHLENVGAWNAELIRSVWWLLIPVLAWVTGLIRG